MTRSSTDNDPAEHDLTDHDLTEHDLTNHVARPRRRASDAKNARTLFPATRFPAAVLPAPVADRAYPAATSHERHRLHVAHDLGHACGTVAMLAAALESAPGMNDDSRRFADQLAGEARRLNELVSDLFQAPVERRTSPSHGPTVHLDQLIQSIADAVQLTSQVDIDVRVLEVDVEQDRLELWRVLRNLICNALEAVAPDGHLRIRLSRRDAFAIVDVDDDGPGYEALPGGGLGLEIVEDLVARWGGWLELGTGALGGCRARLLVPLTRPASGPRVREDGMTRAAHHL